MTLVEKIRLLEDRQHFETMVNEEYEKTMIKKRMIIFFFIAFIFVNLLSFSTPLSSFHITSFGYSFLCFGIVFVVLEHLHDYYHNKMSLIVKEKKYGYLIFNCVLHYSTIKKGIILAWFILFLFTFVAEFFLKHMNLHFMTYVILFIHSFYLLIPLLFLLLSLFASKYIHCHLIDEKINDLIKIEQIEIYNEHFKDLGLKCRTNNKINFMNQVFDKLSDERNNDNLLKELTLLDNFKESDNYKENKLDFVLKETTELNKIALYFLSLNEFNSKKENVLNDLIHQKNNINKKFDELLEKYQTFIDVNQKYLHEGESNTLSFKTKFDKLIESEKSIIEKLENTVDLPNNSENWFIQIENETNSLNVEKENIIEELKLNKQQLEQYIKDILVKEILN